MMSLVVQAQAVIAQSMGKQLSVTGGKTTHTHALAHLKSVTKTCVYKSFDRDGVLAFMVLVYKLCLRHL